MYMTLLDLHKFDPFSIGYDKMFDRLELFNTALSKAVPGYPPYNIKKTEKNFYVLELAVAGFSKEDIDIELTDGSLTVSASAKTSDSKEEFLHKGIADRSFKRKFELADNVEIRNADLKDGMLKISLEYIVPDNKKPKKIEINASQNPIGFHGVNAKEFLTEVNHG
jgi:molecular chaperone IbpA